MFIKAIANINPALSEQIALTFTIIYNSKVSQKDCTESLWNVFSISKATQRIVCGFLFSNTELLLPPTKVHKIVVSIIINTVIEMKKQPILSGTFRILKI